jgi:uncharacterized protein (DUF1697 family)
MHVALLLRGINVGAHRRITMADLKGLLEDGSFEDVTTYLQSGNVRARTSRSAKDAAHRAEELITAFGLSGVVVAGIEWPRLVELVQSQPLPNRPVFRAMGIFLKEPVADAHQLIGTHGALEIVAALPEILLAYVVEGMTHTVDMKRVVEKPLGTAVTARFWSVIEDWVAKVK